MTFSAPPCVALDLGGDHFRVVYPVVYTGAVDHWTIPQGFVTDFATIPAIVSWAVPKLGRHTAAAIVHDVFCESLAGKPWVDPPSSRDADAIFRRIMREDGVDPVTRWLMWTGVRWGALFNRHRRAGWWRDAPAVLALSALAAPVVLPASLLAVGGRLVLRAASFLCRPFAR